MGSTSGPERGNPTGAAGPRAVDRRRVRRGSDRRGSRRSRSTTLDDLLYDGFYSAAVGGSVLSLYFLLIDVVAGQPLFTASLFGSVLFGGVPAGAVTTVRLEMAAYFTIVHFAIFGALGTGLAAAVYEVRRLTTHPLELIGMLLVLLEGGFLLAEGLFMPGVVEVIGFGRITVGNLLTAGAMGLFMLKAENPTGWERLKQGKPLS